MTGFNVMEADHANSWLIMHAKMHTPSFSVLQWHPIINLKLFLVRIFTAGELASTTYHTRLCVYVCLSMYVYVPMYMNMYMCKCICGCGCTCHSTYVEVKGQFLGLVLSFRHVGSEDRFQVVRRGSKCLCLLSYLTPFLFIFGFELKVLKLVKQALIRT